MRRLAVLALILLAAPADAQEQYQFSAEHVTGIDFRRVEHNATVCAQARLPEGCTQAQVDAAVPPRLALKVYSDSARGRNDFVSEVLFADILSESVTEAEAAAEREREEDIKTRCEGLRTSDRDAICTRLGLSAGCDPCPVIGSR